MDTAKQSNQIVLRFNPDDSELTTGRFTGIARHSLRAEQPYTVWVRGETIFFCKTEIEARKSLKPEGFSASSATGERRITRASPAIEKWVGTKEAQVLSAADATSRTDDVEQIVEEALQVNRSEPRFDEIVLATQSLVANRRHAAGHSASNQRPSKAERSVHQEGSKSDEEKFVRSSNSAPSSGNIRSRESRSAKRSARPVKSPTVARARSAQTESPESTELLDILDRSSGLLSAAVSRPLYRLMSKLPLTGTELINEARRILSKAGKSETTTTALSRGARSLQLLGTIELRTAHTVYQDDEGFLLESRVRGDPTRSYAQTVPPRAVDVVSGLLDSQGQSIQDVAKMVEAENYGSEAFRFNDGHQLYYEVERALLVAVVIGLAQVEPLGRGFAFTRADKGD